MDNKEHMREKRSPSIATPIPPSPPEEVPPDIKRKHKKLKRRQLKDTVGTYIGITLAGIGLVYLYFNADNPDEVVPIGIGFIIMVVLIIVLSLRDRKGRK